MGWSLESVSYRMSGTGSWQNVLPDESAQRLYAEIYPAGAPVPRFEGPLRQLLDSWRQARIVKAEGQRVVPLGPIMTEDDLIILAPWFRDISEAMCTAVMERLSEYQSLAQKLAGGESSPQHRVDNILTIIICAHTLDSWVFSNLREQAIGSYPSRDFAGDFFFWGYAFSEGPKRIFGFTTYGGWQRIQVNVIRSRDLDREQLKEVLRQRATWDYLGYLLLTKQPGKGASSRDYLQSARWENAVDSLRDAGVLEGDTPPWLAVPVFTQRDMEPAAKLYDEVSGRITSRFLAGMDGLKALVGQCSFAACTWADVLCMLFHLSYSYAADRLVERGIIPDFPQSAGGEWGVWVRY